MEKKTVIYNRDTIYHEVWNEPMVVISKRYNLSDVGFKKVCKKLNIPTPGKGYWAKLRAGYESEIPKLPEYNGPEEYGSMHIDNSNEELKTKSEKDKYVFLDESIAQKVRNVCSKIRVEDHLSNVHPIISEIKKCHKGSGTESTDLVNSFYRTHARLKGAIVTNTSLERTLIIFDTIFKSFEKLKYNITSDKQEHFININIDNEIIGMKIVEHIKAVRHSVTPEESKALERNRFYSIPKFDYFPSNELKLIIEGDHRSKMWEDKKKSKIENSLEDIMLSVINLAYCIKEAREQNRLAEIRRWEQQKREWEIKRLQEEELEKFSKLENEAMDWHRSKIIENYLKEIEQNLCMLENYPEKQKNVLEWIQWAKDKADWLNPLIAKEDPTLGRRHAKK